MKTLYWHDYETFGVNPARDKPSQFAGVRTDENLNIVGEPFVSYCKPPLDSLPNPMACQVTGITPQQADKEGLAEPEFIHRIHRELSVPGTCGVGYNSIRFDDEVTRYALYRNFHDPYQREWQHGNSRWDIIDMTRLTRALRPEGIVWPDYDDGSPNFRLEYLTAANGIGHESAHDALSDVLATIELAKLIKNKQPKLYDYVYQRRGKKQVAEMVNLFSPKPFLHVSSRLPRENGYVGVMYPLAIHPDNSNAVICFNLAGNIQPLLDWDADKLRERIFTRTEDLGEGEERVLIKAVHLNRCPVVATVKLLDQAAASRLDINLEHCEANWQRLKNVDISAKIKAVFSEPFQSDIADAEQQLYQGFIPNSDKPLLNDVRAMSGDELASSSVVFEDARYDELLFLYRARYFYGTLNEHEKARWLTHRQSRLIDGCDGHLSISQYNQVLGELAENGADPLLLGQLKAWGENLIAELKPAE